MIKQKSRKIALIFTSDNNQFKAIKKSMEYFKKIMSMVCLFDLETQEKQAVNLKKFITVKCSQISNYRQNILDQNVMIQQVCKTLKQEEKGSIAPWIKLQKNKKILLLDLDKTLIYFNHQTGLILRPFLNQFLKELKEHFSIYIFTSATKSYVREVFEKAKGLKAELSYIKGVLTRQNCIKIQKDNAKNIYVKDLSVLTNCSLSDVIIVDDLPVSYCVNKENAVAISPFSGQTQDQQLKKVLKILLNAVQYEDVRDYLPKLSQISIKNIQKAATKQHVKIQRNVIVSIA